MGGFPQEQGCFWLPRALIEPPQEIKQMIFPDIEYWQEQMSQHKEMQTICGTEFLNCLFKLRTIILQDAAIIRETLPDNELFHHEVFRTPQFNSIQIEKL
jgi:hypothetical protein